MLIGLLTLSLAMVAPPEKPDRASLVLVIADDLGRLGLSMYDEPQVSTPGLDKFAKHATVFRRAYATVASCSASRSVMYTGLYNHTNGQYGLQHAEHHFQQFDKIENLISLSRSAGKFTGWVGKSHVGPVEKYEPDYHPTPGLQSAESTRNSMRDFLKQAGDRPFVFIIGFTQPHRTGKGFAPNQRVAKQAKKKSAKQATRELVIQPDRVKVPAYLPDVPEVREDLADYFTAVKELDERVEAALTELDQSPAAKRTMVVFLSDNGIPFPGAKTNVYDAAVHLPFIARLPSQMNGPTTTSQASVSYVDLLPTALDWLDVPPPSYPLPGKSFLSQLGTNAAATPDRPIYFSHTFHEITNYYPMRGIRLGRFKLIHNLAFPLPFPFASDLYNSPTWQTIETSKRSHMGLRSVDKFLHRDEFELYDIDADPHETNNLASDPKHANTVLDLKAKLIEFRKQTSDPWLRTPNVR